LLFRGRERGGGNEAALAIEIATGPMVKDRPGGLERDDQRRPLVGEACEVLSTGDDLCWLHWQRTMGGSAEWVNSGRAKKRPAQLIDSAGWGELLGLSCSQRMKKTAAVGQCERL
jgi:hypothetical protein